MAISVNGVQIHQKEKEFLDLYGGSWTFESGLLNFDRWEVDERDAIEGTDKLYQNQIEPLN